MHSGTIIHMRNVPGSVYLRALDAPLPYKKEDGNIDYIPTDFEWDGSSAEILINVKSKTLYWILWVLFFPINFFMRSVFPRHNHPIASCRHDWRCRMAKNKKERFFADCEFEKDVGTTSRWITKKVGYIGVRLGAYLGIGKYY